MSKNLWDKHITINKVISDIGQLASSFESLHSKINGLKFGQFHTIMKVGFKQRV